MYILRFFLLYIYSISFRFNIEFIAIMPVRNLLGETHALSLKPEKGAWISPRFIQITWPMKSYCTCQLFIQNNHYIQPISKQIPDGQEVINGKLEFTDRLFASNSIFLSNIIHDCTCHHDIRLIHTPKALTGYLCIIDIYLFFNHFYHSNPVLRSLYRPLLFI